MKQWLITATDSEELSKQTNIIYKSDYTNLLGVETELSKDQLLKIKGVLTVDEPAIGHLNNGWREQARAKVREYIEKCGYTYTVDAIVDSYSEYYIKGFYVSYTTKDCIENLKTELEIICGDLN